MSILLPRGGKKRQKKKKEEEEEEERYGQSVTQFEPLLLSVINIIVFDCVWWHNMYKIVEAFFQLGQ